MNRAQYHGKTTILYKYLNDTRYANVNTAATHDKITTPAVPIFSFDGIEVPNVDVIGIDEGQLIRDVPDYAMKAANAGKKVIITALNGQFNLKPWDNVQALIPMAENMMTLHAVCFNCKADASFTKRIDESNQAIEDVGGADKYVASCRKCFNVPVVPLSLL